MSSVSVFCCLRGCLDGFKFHSAVPHVPRENPIQLDTSFMGIVNLYSQGVTND